jgi:nucleotide-binding universal stress UspA family protein
MKTILVPTDFSPAAQNAVNYAAEMASLINAKLILFNVYYVPAVPAEVPLLMPEEEIREASMQSLQNIREKLVSQHAGLEIGCESQFGIPPDEIQSFTERTGIDMIVMGIHGAGYLSEQLMGSVATTLVRRAKCPVLVVAENVKFRSIKKVVLAYDHGETLLDSTLEPLRDLCRSFDSEVYVLNVLSESGRTESVSDVISEIKADTALNGLRHSFHTSSDENVVKGINQFTEKVGADMVVMIPKMHRLLDRILNESKTKEMAFHSKIPLLALHEQ